MRVAPRLVSDVVSLWARGTPHAIALEDADRSWSYAELHETVCAAAHVLEATGVRQADRVFLVCENSSAAVVVYFACTALGAWPVIANARLSDRELDEISSHCGARLSVFATGGSLHALRHAQRQQAQPADFADFSGVMLGPVDDECLPESAEADPENDVAALIYTSGTTGRPKGVMLSHRNLLFAAIGSAQMRRLSPVDRVLSVLPISHILGLSGVVLGAFSSGARIQLLTRFDPLSLLERLENGGTSVLIGTPAMYAMLAEYAARKDCARISAPSLRLISTAGAPLDMATKTKVEAVFDQPLRNGYGITECSPTITLSDIDSASSDCSVGRPLCGVETRFVDASGEDVGRGDMGELLVRGPGVMKGYYRAAEETSRVLDSEGWFRTGDLVRVEGGKFYVIGRSKEMIIRFGFNVYPAEIEAVLNSHPLISRSAVLGRIGAGGEEIIAFVEPQIGSVVRSGELAEYVSGLLATYKRPSAYIIVDAIPLTPAGKVLKSALAAPLAQEAGRVPLSGAL